MDFSHGGGGRTRRDGYSFCEDDEQDDPATRHPFNISSSSSSSSPSSAAAVAASSSAPPSSQIQKEHMFDKVVTPSDVGKLNRLVIPKQHAERYFPLDTATHEKGLLLSFEDRTGKQWRFRYSYWNSSQSYVMTKGWSRFVKEKRLDAGDTVSFGRGVDDKDRLFIDCKRRPEIIHDPPRGPHYLPRIPLPSNYQYQHHHPMVSFARPVGPLAGRILVPQTAAVYDGHHHRHQNYLYNAAAAGGGGAGQYLVFRSAVGRQQQAAVQLGSSGGGQDGTLLGSAAAAAAPMVLESVPVVQTQAAAAKRMRLFGVNLDFPADSEGDPGESSVRSQTSGTFSSSSSPSPRGKEKQEPSLDLDM